jgi:hypothetical protein
LLDCRLQSLSRTTNFAARTFFEPFSSGNAVYECHAQHTQKKMGRVLFPLNKKTSQYRRLFACVIAQLVASWWSGG